MTSTTATTAITTTPADENDAPSSSRRELDRMRRRSFLLPLFLVVDVACSVLSMGFYSESWTFDFDLVFKYLTFIDGYNYFTNPMDFVFLSILRLVLLLTAVTLITFHRDAHAKAMFMPMIGFATFCYSYTLVKMLAFSEDVRMMRYPGLWCSVVWSMTAALLFSLIWYFIITSHDFDYQRLVSERMSALTSSDDSSDVETAVEREGETEVNPFLPTRKRISTLQHIRALLKYCQNQWVWFTLGFIFLVIYAVARVFIPNFTGQVIANIVKKAGVASLVRSVLIMGALTMVSTLFGGLRGGCFDYATALVSRQVRLDLFRSLVNQDIAFFDVTKSGEIVSRLTSDCQTMSTTVSTNLNVFLRNGVMLVGALVFMFIMSWRLSLVTFIAIPLVGFITKWYGAYYDKLSEKTQTTIADANQIADEVLSTMRTVRSFACERREVDRFEGKLGETLKMNRKKAIAYMGYTWNNEFCDNAILVAVLFYGGHLVMSDMMTTDQLITFLLYQMQLGENLYNIGYVMTGLMECVGASRKVFEYMYREPEIRNNGEMKPPLSGRIEFKQVNFTYPSRPNNKVLKGLDLVVEAGRTTALVGPSGGGKSSIVSLIEHFYEPTRGIITIDGVNIKDISHSFYHQKIALVAQEPVLYNGSVRYNITYGCDWATEEDMLRAAKTANVHNFVTELDKGYETNCGEKGVQMSGGQKQRIAIARALVRNPVVLILDEATSALDAESEALVQEALNRCARERTVLIIAHRLSTIEKADQIAVINKGRLVQTGTHAQLMADVNDSLESVAMTNSVVADCLLVLFIVTDLPFTVLFFGFYSPSWYFHVDLITKQFSSFTYSCSPLDFIVVAALRSAGLLGLRLYLRCAADVWDLRMHFLGIATAIYSHALVKLLCFAEWPQMLRYPGVWANVIWSITAAAIFFVLCCCYQASDLFDYSRLESTEESTARVFIPAYIGRVLANIALGGGMSELIRSMAIMCLLALGSIVFGGLRGGTFSYATALVSRQIKLDLFRSLVRQEIAFFDMTKSGEIVSRISSDCQVMATNVSTHVNVFMRNSIMLIGSLCVMFYTSWKLTTRLSEQTQATIAKANNKAEEVLGTMRTVRSFACENYEVDEFEDSLNTTLHINRKKSIAYMGYTWNNEFSQNAVLIAVLCYGGNLTADSLITFLLYQIQIGENIYWVAFVVAGIMDCVGASRKARLCILFSEKSFQGFTLTIPAGSIVALVGPSGGGKSSIVSLLQHMYEPDSGTITIDDVPIKNIDHEFYHENVVLVAQEPVLYNGSIRDNILYGCDWATEEDMLEAAEMANVHGFVMELEKKYDTLCGDRGVQMSGGQKQRIAIARALVRKPCVLILDEATSALDAESEAQVQEAINRCASKVTVLIVAHRLSTVEKADIIAVIQKGSVVQIGTHKTLMENTEGLYYALVSRQLLTEMS
ncbi:hypothetical protein GCK32_001549 [Trichostrongylus colubriformis]|uniref:ABC-type antigen peptide transporter n=1 Tax=Trichostrongylus colubriformis TaxID=6319 RepID=A0AAN8EZ20_TRICO